MLNWRRSWLSPKLLLHKEMSVKKIIAREGLTIIVWMVFIAESALWAVDYRVADLLIANRLVPTDGIFCPSYFYARIVDWLILLVYPLYQSIRFIVWSVITLAEPLPGEEKK